MKAKNAIPLLISLIIILSAANPIVAQNSVVSQAVKFKVSLPVRDLPLVVGNNPGLDETNIKNRKVIRQVDQNAPGIKDGALFSDKTNQNGTVTPQIPNPPSVSFEGIALIETIPLGQGFLPPDPTVDVGPNHVVQAVNVAFRIWDKAGNPLTPVATFSSLFAPLGSPCGSVNDGDPIVIYDQLADRWFISQFCTVANPNNHQLIAISQTGDPTGAYYLYDFIMPNNKFNDYPKFGVWPDAYYMTDNQFNQAGTAFLGAGVFAFDRMKMLVGDPTASYIYFDLFTLDPSIGGMLPADMDGLIPPPAGSPCPFAYFIATEFGDPSDGIRIFDFHADFSVPTNSTFLERTGSPLAVAAFDPRALPLGSRDNIPQPPPSNPATASLDAIGDRLMFRLAYRNFGSSESLIANHTVNADVNPVYRAGVRFYQLTRATPAAAFTVAEQQTFAGAVGDLEDRWMGSGAMNHQADIAVGYSVSSLTVFPSIRYAAKLGTDPAGSGLAQGEASIIAGTGVQTHTSSRWGDYSQMTVDPSDDCNFWYTQEYYDSTGSAPWQTRIAKMAAGPCTVSPRGTINGTITDCSTGLPIQNAQVSFTGGYFRSTNAAGFYTLFVSPGTYNASVTAPLYGTATGMVTVLNGGTSVFNACLNGVAALTIDQVTITAEDCNSNGRVDPNENITVDVSLLNSGTSNTTSLVATLQASAQVISPSAPQNYGVIVAGGPAVTRSFSFTASNFPCGQTFVLTFQLQDGATNYGTVSQNLPTGTLGSAGTTTYSTGNIAVPIPDVSSVDIPLVITDIRSITDVNVRMRINHTFDGDLNIKLVHPDGTIVQLVTNRGGSGANFGTGANDCSGTPTILDDEAATAISVGVAPFAGSFRPEALLSVLDGKPTNGTWILRVADEAALDVGTVGCFQLVIAYQNLVCCGSLAVIDTAGATVTAESCTSPAGTIDPGETVTINFCVRNNGGSNTVNLVGTLQATGGVTAPSGPQNFGIVVAGGPPVCRPYTFTVNGTCGGSITATIQLQDGATNYGTITYTFTLGTISTSTQTFSNPAPILIPATGTSGPAAPYPSTINVAGITDPVSNVTVTLRNMNHTFPDDIDVLLVGPGGQKLLLMSDAGGSADLVNNTYTFDDAAVAALADGALNASGTYKPSNYGTGDAFVAPAPVGPYPDPQLLSVFNGVNPNGTWSLYIVDDVGGDVGNVNLGWELNITTFTYTCCVCTITCPANITVSNDPNQCGAVVNYPPPTASGGCGTVTTNPPSGSFFPVGTTTVTATTVAGPSCSFTITVNDTQAPTIICPANITVSNDPNQCGAVVNYPAPTVSDNCPGVTFASSPASGSFFPVGTTTVFATATDAAGNTASCTFTVTVNDTQAPTITCPADIILCGSQAVSFTVTASDNCPGVTVVSVPASGSVFPVGTTTVTSTATDGSGNTATCSFTVTIRPIPSVNPVPNQTVCNAAPTAPVIFSGPVPGTTFNWVNNTPSIGLAASGSGNIASFNAINLTNVPVTATITVTPVTIPSGTVTFNYTGAFQTWVVPAGVTSVSIQASGAQGRANAAGVSQGGLGGTASGNLAVTPGETLWVYVGGGGTTGAPGGFNGGGNGGTTGTCLTALGGGGGGASDVRQITNTLAGRRIVGAGGGGTAGNRVAACARGAGGGGGGGYYGGGGGCGYPGTTGVVPTGGTQAAGGVGGITGTTFGATNGLPGVSGIGGNGGNEIASAQAGSQAVIFGSGAGGGLTGGAGQQSGLNNFTGQSGAGGSSYIGGVTGGTTTAGVRSGNGLVTISYAVPGPTCTGPSTSFTITVNPTPNAVATPPTQTICSGTAMTPIVLSGNVSGTVFNWVRNNTVNVTGIPNSGSGNISGTPINNTTVQQTVIFTITPIANGCTGTPVTATLIVNKAPTITCPANITVNNTAGQCGAVVNYPAPVATGSPAPVVVSVPASGSFFPVGTTTVTATATNICGVATCTFTITVLDVQAPTITCPANIVRNTDVGVCTATIAVPNPITADNCAVTQLTWVMTGATTGSSPATGINFVGTQTFNLNGTTGQGVTTIVYTVRDAAGNTASCSFTVTVNDLWIPVIGGQPTNQTVCVGSNAVFSVIASVPAGNPLTYQWQAWNGSAWVNIAGATNATLPLNAVVFSMNTNSYRCILTGRCSVVTSGFATLYVNQLPTISLLASGPLALLPAQFVTLTAVVSPGGGSYQWFKNGVAITGATGASLGGLTVNDVGAYRCRYTDLNGCVATSADMLVSAQASDNLYVYPNPNDGLFHVRFYNQVGEEVTVNVFDAKGALIFTRKTITTTPYTDITVDLGGRNTAGTYLVVLRDASGRQVGAKKIIVYDR